MAIKNVNISTTEAESIVNPTQNHKWNFPE